MPNDPSNAGFQSVLASFMDKFLQEKHACGYAYHMSRLESCGALTISWFRKDWRRMNCLDPPPGSG